MRVARLILMGVLIFILFGLVDEFAMGFSEGLGVSAAGLMSVQRYLSFIEGGVWATFIWASVARIVDRPGDSVSDPMA